MIVTGLSGIKYQLDSKHLSDGGEGRIHQVLGVPAKVAKVYKSGIPSRDLEEKLKYMTSNHPSENILNQVAWPLDVIYDPQNKFCGFVMPKLQMNVELEEIYKYPSLIASCYQKIVIAENICAVISEIHKDGYVFGDFNPRNIAVDMKPNSGMVAFLDTDSYHVIINNPRHKEFRCNVCAPGYSAPELLEKCASHIATNPGDKGNAYARTPLPTFTTETDNFALAIHIFKLLMNGFSPYGGIPDISSPSQASPGTGDAAVRRDNYCFKPGNKPQSTAVPFLNTFPLEMDALFTRAFIDGKQDPKKRPTSLEWFSFLRAYENTLVSCPKNSLHQYYDKNITCPYCEADQRYVYMMGSSSSILAQPIVTSPVLQKNSTNSPHAAAPVYQTFISKNISPSPPQKSTPKIMKWLKFTVIAIAVFLLIGIWPKVKKASPDSTSSTSSTSSASLQQNPAESEQPTILPGDIQYSIIDENSITLYWDSSGPGFIYRIYYSTEDNPFKASYINATENKVTVTGLTSNTAYYFWLALLQDSGIALNLVAKEFKTLDASNAP